MKAPESLTIDLTFFIQAFIYLRTKKTLQRDAKALKIKNYLVLVFGS